jgi:hypothetical protein
MPPIATKAMYPNSACPFASSSTTSAHSGLTMWIELIGSSRARACEPIQTLTWFGGFQLVRSKNGCSAGTNESASWLCST